MAILVDRAVWRWRGRRWAHLVSDAGYDELHAFADRLGLRREWFQGDHYDVPESVRDQALRLGAVPMPSRELVLRLRAAGLRKSRIRERSSSEAEAHPIPAGSVHVPQHIVCVDCGGRCHLLSLPRPDEGFSPGDIVAYRCEDCLDRWDLVLPDDAPAASDPADLQQRRSRQRAAKAPGRGRDGEVEEPERKAPGRPRGARAARGGSVETGARDEGQQ
jgi:hypothetical protein